MAETSHKLQFARRMRKEPATTEDFLWRLLRGRRLEGLKFRRQVPIGPYVADFVCFRHRLIVEADGPMHEGRVTDVERDEWLRRQGFNVLRFRNTDVRDHPEETLQSILRAVGRDG